MSRDEVMQQVLAACEQIDREWYTLVSSRDASLDLLQVHLADLGSQLHPLNPVITSTCEYFMFKHAFSPLENTRSLRKKLDQFASELADFNTLIMRATFNVNDAASVSKDRSEMFDSVMQAIVFPHVRPLLRSLIVAAHAEDVQKYASAVEALQFCTPADFGVPEELCLHDDRYEQPQRSKEEGIDEDGGQGVSGTGTSQAEGGSFSSASSLSGLLNNSSDSIGSMGSVGSSSGGVRNEAELAMEAKLEVESSVTDGWEVSSPIDRRKRLGTPDSDISAQVASSLRQFDLHQARRKRKTDQEGRPGHGELNSRGVGQPGLVDGVVHQRVQFLDDVTSVLIYARVDDNNPYTADMRLGGKKRRSKGTPTGGTRGQRVRSVSNASANQMAQQLVGGVGDDVYGNSDSNTQSEVWDPYLPYRAAVVAFSCLRHVQTPMEKVEALVATLQWINHCVVDYWQDKTREDPELDVDGEKLMLNTDVVIPLLCYVIVHARVPDLVVHLFEMDRFLNAGLGTGKQGYAVATLQVCFAFLLDNWRDVLQGSLRIHPIGSPEAAWSSPVPSADDSDDGGFDSGATPTVADNATAAGAVSTPASALIAAAAAAESPAFLSGELAIPLDMGEALDTQPPLEPSAGDDGDEGHQQEAASTLSWRERYDPLRPYLAQLGDGASRRIMDRFSCILGRFPLRGWLLLTGTHLVWEADNVTGGDDDNVSIVIPLTSVVYIKKGTYVGLETCIDIVLSDRKNFTFAYVLRRDEAYATILSQVRSLGGQAVSRKHAR